MLENMFISMLITSVAGAALTVILMIFRPITKRCFSAAWHYYIWLAVLTVMILPLRIDLPEKNVDSKPQFYISETVPDLTILNVDEIATLRVEKATEINNVNNINFTTEQIAYIWLGIAVIIFLVRLFGYFIFLFRMKRTSKISECPMLREFTNRKVTVRICDGISSPLMFGIIRPTLILPGMRINATQMEFVLAHEITHLKRWDIIYKWFAMLVKCIHWFNPAVYFIQKRIEAECEISCDLSVTKSFSDAEKISYVETILELLTNGRRCSSLSTGMTGNKNLLKVRFAMIKKNMPVRKTVGVVSVIVAVIITVFALYVSGVMGGNYIDETVTDNEMQKMAIDSETEFIWPSPHSNNITRKFSRNHTGIDIATPKGLGIIAAIAGEVIDAGFSAEKGNYIVISSSEIKTEYRHLETIGVTVGQHVSAGELIGASGSTGMSTGSHLHFEVTKNGEYVDPEIFADERVYANEKRIHPIAAGVKESDGLEFEKAYKGEQRTREYPAIVTAEMLLTATEQVESKAETANLKASYVISEYDMDNGTGAEITVKPDLNGTISLFFETDTQTAVADITIEENKENGEAWVYYLPTNSSMVYDFCGFEQGEEYTVKVGGYYPGNYGINGTLLVY